MKRFKFILYAVVILTLGPAPAQAQSDAGFRRIEVYPPSVSLVGREARQQILVTGIRADRSTLDLTDRATVESANPSVARLDSGVVRPVADGAAMVRVRAGGYTVTIPVRVRAMRAHFHWSFENHVESVFSKQGCNTGACHGALSGKGGFRLSLRAFDPDADYLRLRTEGRGRRIARTHPADSLLLRKPSLSVAHMGGLRLRRDSLEYRVVREWIAEGANGPSPAGAMLTGLDVYPADRTLPPSGSQRLLVTARFSDGHAEDVTRWARYSSNEEPIAKVDDTGRITMAGRGETAVTVWYLGRVAFARVRVPFNTNDPRRLDRIKKIDTITSKDLKVRTDRTGHEITRVSRSTRPHLVNLVNPVKESSIDALIDSKLTELGLVSSGPCSDGEFVRRAFLDCIGTLPEPEETRRFLADLDPSKRRRLIDSLLDRPEFVDFWAYRWSDLLRVNRDLIGGKAAAAMHAWLRQGVAENLGWDRVAYQLLTASGSTDTDGPASFYRMGTKPEEFAETVSQAFLGIRVQCAHCHNHPFEKWTQTDYYRMANVFARVGRKEVDGIETVFTASTGEVNHPRFGRPLAPAAFDGPALPLSSPLDRREYLAKWVIAPDNPYFSRAIVNRVWKQFMGRGLVEPVDDMRLTNPASNEPLLRAVTADLVHSGFDLKRLMRQIMLSRAYQCSSSANALNRADDRYYSHYLSRRLGAETLLDAVCQVTGAPEKFKGVPAGLRAVSLPDTRVASSFLDTFGRPARQVTCECERNMEPNMSQALHLINASTLNDKIIVTNATLERLLASGPTTDALIDDLYLRCLCRRPTPSERRAVIDALFPAITNARDLVERRRQVFGDLLWALLGSPEFVYNH
jgi:hypothetical protein